VRLPLGPTLWAAVTDWSGGVISAIYPPHTRRRLQVGARGAARHYFKSFSMKRDMRGRLCPLNRRIGHWS
jgi:hypothetical protein